MTLIAFALNLLIAWAALRWAWLIGRILGDAGSGEVLDVIQDHDLECHGVGSPESEDSS